MLKWPNGSYFQGEWRAGKRNGQGLLIYPDGSSFTGGMAVLNLSKRSMYGIVLPGPSKVP